MSFEKRADSIPHSSLLVPQQKSPAVFIDRRAWLVVVDRTLPLRPDLHNSNNRYTSVGYPPSEVRVRVRGPVHGLAQKLAGAGRADKKGTLSMENLSRATAAVNALPARLAGQHDVAATQFGEYRTITKTGGNRIGSGAILLAACPRSVRLPTRGQSVPLFST
jgi:hypothetical protein